MNRSTALVGVVLGAAALACGSPPTPPAPPPPGPSVTPPAPSASVSVAVPAASSAPAGAADARPPADLGRAACQKGEVRGCDVLAEVWGAREMLPVGAEAQAREDAATLRQACDQGKISSACMGLALMLKYGTATGQHDGDAARPYWAKVRELGDLNGFRDGASAEGKASLEQARRDCASGRARSCNQLGWAAYTGVPGREPDIQEAFASYAEGCRLGSALGCRWAGHYAHRYLELKAGARAEELLRRGCEGQGAGACAELGNFYMVERKGQGAEAPLEQACAGGSRDGCRWLGEVRLGQGKERRSEAAQLLRRACDAEQDEACDRLGGLLERGDGVPKNPDAALAAYQRGCSSPQQTESCAALSRLAGADRSAKCVLDQPNPRIGEKGVKVLKLACKSHGDQKWCLGVTACK